MTTTKDVRDMLGVTPDQVVPRPKPSKKKPKTTLPRPDGITRELFALMGERAPPIPIATKPKFKAKLARNTTPSKWRWTPFLNEARTDDLQLGHWRKEDPPRTLPEQSQSLQTEDSNAESQTQKQLPEQDNEQKTGSAGGPGANEPDPSQSLPRLETSAPPHANTDTPPAVQTTYPFAKYNLKIPKLEYTDLEYETHLRTEDWTRAETDYLVELVSECSQKWPVIQDRYDFKPDQAPHTDDTISTELQPASKERSIDELKMRFYTVSAKIMELRTPLSTMTADELTTHDKMTKFSPAQEITRKRLKEALLIRSVDEKREEEYLLAELRRIWTHQQRFSTELRDLRQRLDHSLTDEPADFQPLTSSQAINNVFQKVFQNRDKGKMQRRSLTGEPNNSSPAAGGPHPTLNTAAAQAAAASGGAGSASATPTTATSNKKGANTANSALNQGHRLVSTRHEARFGITTHERLTGGITFRSDKLTKSRQAKSLTQTQKIAAVLAELGIPDLLQMPTVSVCEAMESLVSKVNLLIDARRVREKEENELKIANQQLRTKKGLPEPADEQAGEDTTAEANTDEQQAQKAEGTQDMQSENVQTKTEDRKDGDQDTTMTDAPAENKTGDLKDDNAAASESNDVEDKATKEEENDEDVVDEEDEEEAETTAVAEAEEYNTPNDETNQEGDAEADAEDKDDFGDDDDDDGSNPEDDEEPDEELELEENEDGDQGAGLDADFDGEPDDNNDEDDEDGKFDDPDDEDDEGDNEDPQDPDDDEVEVDGDNEDEDNDMEPPSSPPQTSSPAPSVSRPATRNGSVSGAQTPTANTSLGVGTRTRGKRSASVMSAASSVSNAGPSAGVRRGDRKRPRR